MKQSFNQGIIMEKEIVSPCYNIEHAKTIVGSLPLLELIALADLALADSRGTLASFLHCQVQNLDTGELTTLTREKAKELQLRTKLSHVWYLPRDNKLRAAIFPHTQQVHGETFNFTESGIYTYETRQALVSPEARQIIKDCVLKEIKALREQGIIK